MKDPLSWLREELPKWQDKGLIAADQAEQIRKYYSTQGTGEKSSGLLLVLFGIIGSLLIGGGLILIIAHNWSELPRGARAFVSVIPLIVSQVLAGWTLTKRSDSAAWRESVGIGWTLSISCAIAMVAQTYHMPGSFDTFTMTWMLLTLPVLYLMRSVSVLLIYLAGITIWGVSSEHLRGHSYEFWLLFAAAVPIVRNWCVTKPYGGAATLARWAMIIVLIISLMGFVEYHDEIPWLIVNSFFAAALFLYGVLFEKDAPSGWQKPASIIGCIFLVILSYCLTWHWFWSELDGRFLIWEAGDQPWLYVSALAFVALAYVTTFSKVVMSKSPVATLWGAVPLALTIGLLAVRSDLMALAVIWIMNAYVLCAGLLTLWSGVRYESLTRVNVGMIVVAGLIVSRFFDEEFSILTRAVVFIVLGIVFLSVNMRLARKKRRAEA